jgi:hypothetical protein
MTSETKNYRAVSADAWHSTHSRSVGADNQTLDATVRDRPSH